MIIHTCTHGVNLLRPEPCPLCAKEDRQAAFLRDLPARLDQIRANMPEVNEACPASYEEEQAQDSVFNALYDLAKEARQHAEGAGK